MSKERKTSNPSCSRIRMLGMAWAGSRDFVHLYLEPPGWDSSPGQFVMLRPSTWGFDPLWPRPFSICEKTPEYLRLFIQVVGKGTSLLRSAAPDSEIVLWGPLGKGFRIPVQHPLLILAGGMGIAPFVGMCKTHPHPERISLLFGHRLGLEHYPLDELPGKIRKESMRQSTPEDLVDFSGVLQERIRDFAPRGEILACGPMPFLRVVQRHVLESNARAQLSVETRMACGVGACLGCVIRTRKGEMVQTCVHGPVFDARELVLQ